MKKTCNSAISALKYEVAATRALERGWIGDRLKDTTDDEWTVFSRTSIDLIPWLVCHFVGSQLLKKYNKAVSWPAP